MTDYDACQGRDRQLAVLMRVALGAAAAGLGIVTAAPASAEPAPVVPAPTPAASAGQQTNPLADVGLLMPQNFGMPTGEAPSPYVLGENPPSGFARVDAYQGVHALLHSALGRMPGDQLGQPLAGTAPPPGTAVPPGLVQFFDPLPLGVPAPN